LVNVSPERDETPETLSEAAEMLPEAVTLVDETDARELCPEILRDAPCKNPEAEMLVSDAFTILN